MVLESWNVCGDTLFVEVSATKKENLDKLKESILLQAEILDLKALATGAASGVVIESKIDKGKGPVSTILISNGLLKRGDHFVCGNSWGKIRAMIDHDGKTIPWADLQRRLNVQISLNHRLSDFTPLPPEFRSKLLP